MSEDRRGAGDASEEVTVVGIVPRPWDGVGLLPASLLGQVSEGWR